MMKRFHTTKPAKAATASGKKGKAATGNSPSNNPPHNPMWGGHFAGGQAEAMQAIGVSIQVDKALYRQDIEGSIAHAEMLASQRIISKQAKKEIVEGLQQILQEIEQGSFTFKPALEDIHMNIEARLKEIVGEAAGKLHTARSRNDQVATDFKLWIRAHIDALDTELTALQQALLARAEEHAATLLPGMTHLQNAQPVTLGHHLLAYVEMFGRDRGRFANARTRLNECPLGAAALAGTSFPLDRKQTAKALGFARPTANSIDSVSDRDFALEFLSAGSILAMHLSRIAEELVLWTSRQFGYITLSEQYTTGSSIMPQKRNPDGAELIRGKTGRIYGNLLALLTVMKGLPLAYNRDTQEDKEPVFDTAETLLLCLPVLTGMIEDFTANKETMRLACDEGYATATDLADFLVRELNIPFRDSHAITGKIVRMAEEMHCQLHELSLEQMQSIEPRLTEKVFSVLSVEDSANSRTSQGGTAPAAVRQAVRAAKDKYL